MVSDYGLNISQLHTPLRMLRYKVGTILFKPKTRIKLLCEETI